VKRYVVDLGDQKEKWLKLFTMLNLPRNIQIDKKEASRSSGSGNGSSRRSLQVVMQIIKALFCE